MLLTLQNKNEEFMSEQILDLINNIDQNDYVTAQSSFQDILASKLQDKLEQERVKVASIMFNSDDESDECDDEELNNSFDELDTEIENDDFEIDDTADDNLADDDI